MTSTMHSSIRPPTSLVLVLLVIMSFSDFQCIFTNGESFADRWAIEDNPQSLIENNTYYLTFGVHDSITAANIVGEFRELSCDENGTALSAADGILEWGSDITAPGKGTLYFQYDIPLFRNNSNIFQVDPLGLKAGFHLCVSYILQTADGSNTIISRRNLDITISLEMETGLTLDIPDPGEAGGDNGNGPVRGVYNFDDNWGVTAYLCDTESPSVPLTGMTFSQGSLISVCITPTANSISRGLLMEKIERFVWSRGYAEQPAVENGRAASNALTHYDCSPGALYCTISSVLFADFYSRRNLRFALHPNLRPATHPGASPDNTVQSKRDLSASIAVVGSGLATMMFSNDNGRHLVTERRGLQSDSETSYLELSVNIRTIDDKLRLIQDDDSLSETSGVSSVRVGLLFSAIGLLINGAIVFA